MLTADNAVRKAEQELQDAQLQQSAAAQQAPPPAAPQQPAAAGTAAPTTAKQAPGFLDNLIGTAGQPSAYLRFEMETMLSRARSEQKWQVPRPAASPLLPPPGQQPMQQHGQSAGDSQALQIAILEGQMLASAPTR